MDKKLKKIIGKLLKLTKEIYLNEPSDGSGSLREGSGNLSLNQPFVPKWWITHHGLQCCEDIAKMAIGFPQLEDGDRDSFSKSIEQILRNNANNNKLFNSNMLFFQKSNNLFESRAIKDPEEFSNALWQVIRLGLANSIVNWLVLYPLRTIKAESFALGFDGLSILKSSDQEKWTQLSEKYDSDSKYWNPSGGNFEGVNHSSFKDFLLVPTWLVCEVSGMSAVRARECAGDFMRTFIALLFSYLDSQNPNLLIINGADISSYSIQFPNNSAKAQCGYIRAGIGNLFPSLLMEKPFDLSTELLSEIQRWYVLREDAPKDFRQRAITASHFLHYGIIHSGLERFIHFFITLDALFCERNKVEKNIKQGIKIIFLEAEEDWKNRAEKLFDLRNEVLHGGISSIKNWNDLYHYRRHFKSEPMCDIKTAAMTALRVYFAYHVFDYIFNRRVNPMSSLTIKLNDKTRLALEQRAQAEEIDAGQWVERLIRRHVHPQWPNNVRALAGAWENFPNIEELRKDLGEDIPREIL